MHAFTHAPAALRIFRFAADSAPRVLEITHVSKFLRECAVEFGSADAALPGALRGDYAAKRFFKLIAVVERNAARCPWLAAKLLACRSGAPVPAAAMAPDVTRHDVNWGAEGARRHADLQLARGGFGLQVSKDCDGPGRLWAQDNVGVTSGKHYFQVCVTAAGETRTLVGFVDDKICVTAFDLVGFPGTRASGAVYDTDRRLYFGTAPVVDSDHTYIDAPKSMRSCAIGCLLNLDATPARMTVFVDGEPLAVQCEYDFPKDGRAWFPSVGIPEDGEMALYSCAI
jgi:hypothetical protein